MQGGDSLLPAKLISEFDTCFLLVLMVFMV